MEVNGPEDVVKAFDRDGFTTETLNRFLLSLEEIGDTDWRYLFIYVIIYLVSDLKKLDKKNYATPNRELRAHRDFLEQEMQNRCYGYLLLQSASSTTKNLASTTKGQTRNLSPDLELPKKIPLYLKLQGVRTEKTF